MGHRARISPAARQGDAGGTQRAEPTGHRYCSDHTASPPSSQRAIGNVCLGGGEGGWGYFWNRTESLKGGYLGTKSKGKVWIRRNKPMEINNQNCPRNAFCHGDRLSPFAASHTRPSSQLTLVAGEWSPD
ncbi:hypothetical protein KIL84_004027 [Mauremys mutica]|uniref:Uncharacterized protein n=1 Tax=Mauremys mutica TaxID=74926 RepID=A0A9D4B6T3_9SAUR|nr:hypothetical protein KIL84_004027 [Mauremys mutica]